jgi:tetratricopeptide (TPR) repeat protein
MEQGWKDLRSNIQLQALVEIEADIENVRSAWRHYLNNKNISGLWSFIHGLWYFHYIRWWNHAGLEIFAETVRELKGENDQSAVILRALAQAYQGNFMAWLGLSKQGFDIAQESVAILEEYNHFQALAFAYNSLSINAYFLHESNDWFEANYRMHKIALDLDDKWLRAYMLFAQGLSSVLLKDYPKARELAEEELKLYEELGDEIGSTTPLIVLGHVALGQGKLEEAREHYLRSLEISKRFSFYYSMQTTAKYLSKVSISLNKLDEAENYLLQSLRITQEIGFVRDIVNLIYEYARLFHARNNPQKAVQLLSLVIDHPASETYRMLEGQIKDSAQELLSEIENHLSKEDLQRNLESGRELEIDQVVMELLSSEINMGGE